MSTTLISLTIDGQELQAEKGWTLLEAARKNGLEIPTLCHHRALLPFGACRLCVVEIRKGDKSTLEAACTYPVEEGLTVQTNTPRVLKVRKMVLEFLQARCPGIPAIEELAAKMGTIPDRLPVQNKNNEKCILCGRCVRVCREVIGTRAISFVYRGSKRQVSSPFFEHAEDCVGCTACAFVCPTGAIRVSEEKREKFISPWNTKVTLVDCAKCGRHFAPAKVVDLLHEQNKLADKRETLCPDCRRKEVAASLEPFDLTSPRVFLQK